jgi:hypothetical protein
MASKKTESKIICPCCQATLVVDRETLGILYHTEHREKAVGASFDQALQELKEKEKSKSSLFQKAVNDEKQRRALMRKKFEELQKHVADNPDAEQPSRPFDFE